jgi:hypothetical protein
MVQEHSGIEIDAPLDLVSALGLVTALTYSVTILASTVHTQNLCIAALVRTVRRVLVFKACCCVLL